MQGEYGYDLSCTGNTYGDGKRGSSGVFTDIISTCARSDPLIQSKIPVTKIAHISYNAKNMDAMLKFYDIDGFGPHKDETPDCGSIYGYRKMDFEVDDIQKIRENLVAAGVMIQEDIHGTIYGSRELKVYDPDGNEVQFTEYSQKEAEYPGMDKDADPCSCSKVN